MPQDIRRRPLNRARFLVYTWLGNRVTECVREHPDDGRVVARKVVELDRFRDPICLFGRLGGTDEDVLVVLARILELEKCGALLDRAGLTSIR